MTPDHVNPEAPWPHLARLERATERRRPHAGRAARDLSRATRASRAMAGRRRCGRACCAASTPQGFARERRLVRRRRGTAARPHRRRALRPARTAALGRDRRRDPRPRAGGQRLDAKPRSSACSRPAATDFAARVPRGRRTARARRAATRSATSSTATSTTPTSAPIGCRFCAFSKGGTAEPARARPTI